MQSDFPTSLLYLWKKRSFFIGTVEKSLNISTGASTIMFALEKDIHVSNEKTSFYCRSLLVPAGEAINIDPQGGIIANCTLDPAGLDFHNLKQKMNDQNGVLFLNFDNEILIINRLIELQNNKNDIDSIDDFLSQELLCSCENWPDQIGIPPFTDPRIKLILEYIESHPRDNTSLSELASMIHISESYLSELFKQTTGIPIRRYRLWCRVYNTVASTCLGRSLTDSAIDMGFNDSPHFNRTFRSMLGIAPSTVFSQPNGLTVLPPKMS